MLLYTQFYLVELPTTWMVYFRGSTDNSEGKLVCYGAVIVVIVIISIFSYFSRRRERRETIASIREGENILAKWSYSPEEWKKYAEDESSGWIQNKDIPGEAFITRTNVYVTNGNDEYFFEFEKERKLLTRCSYLNSFIKLRIEWLTTSTRRIGTYGASYDTYNHHHEDFRLFVPVGNEEKVSKLMTEFNNQIHENRYV